MWQFMMMHCRTWLLPKQVATDFWETFKPGGRLHPTYILEHQWHLVFEGALLLLLAYLLFQRSSKPSSKLEKPLSERVRPPLASSLTEGMGNWL